MQNQTIQITIRGRVYTLRTDEDPQRIAQIASELDDKIAEFSRAMRGRPETEILTIAAFDIMETLDNVTGELEALKGVHEKAMAEDKRMFDENLHSAESELAQIANVKEQENEALRIKLQEYEMKAESAVDTANEAVHAKEAENVKLKETLQNFEKIFDEFAKTKERDILRMQEEIETLKLKLAELDEDGQLTL